MNPEFERNVWLELTPLRLIAMSVVLALAFFAAALSDGWITPGATARVGFALIVVVWGTGNAARAVIGEIRERTWDFQRLGALGAGPMMWGKLFGATVFNWFGGVLCLAVIAADAVHYYGIGPAAEEIAYWIAMGVIAEAVSLFVSLIAARRRQSRTGFEILLYQAIGIAAALVVWLVADPSGTTIGIFARDETTTWWGLTVSKSGFYLTSLAVFTAWVLTGCYRQMRLELKLVNGPFVWLAFLAFMVLYAAGFQDFAPPGGRFDATMWRLMLAAIVAADLAYVTVFLEPKNRVQLRWLAGEFGKFRLGSALAHLPCWMMSYLAAAVLAAVLIGRFAVAGMAPQAAGTVAILGFFTRDLAIVVLMSTVIRRGGDLMAIAVLFVLYALLPSIVLGLHYTAGRALFLPLPTEPIWLGPALAWLEALAVWTAAAMRIALGEKKQN